ncbi:unnamed protein product [Sphagnum troendelagicum]|uniref:Uncharacterized protein n=1 Tax=Sphagnum troendelagicum TaxID=128251 RepID=A0ABP0TQX7_9BRYO
MRSSLKSSESYLTGVVDFEIQGEDCPYERHLDDTLPLVQIPDVLRALGMNPSNSDIDDILIEIRQPYINSGSDPPTTITFDNFACIYANHKPCSSYNRNHIYQALLTLGADSTTSKIASQPLFEILQKEGENMSRGELEQCLSTCLQQEVSLDKFPEMVDYTYIAYNVLDLPEDT